MASPVWYENVGRSLYAKFDPGSTFGRFGGFYLGLEISGGFLVGSSTEEMKAKLHCLKPKPAAKKKFASLKSQ